jgi:hypothetical protein
MSRIKLAVVSVLAVAAVCAVAAGTASAAQETRYFVEGTELKATETVDGAVGVAQLNSTLLGQKIMIECTANELTTTGENTIEEKGKSKTEIIYKQCYVYTISKGTRELLLGCGVETITFKAIDQLIAGPGGLVEDEFKPSTGEVFVSINIVNANGKTCSLKSKDEVKGSYVASFGDEGERSSTEHELVFTSTGSKVTFAGEPASYTNTVSRLKLRSGKNFY